MNAAYSWLLAGVLLVVAEALGISGIGLLFAGLGAMTAGAFVQLEYIGLEDTVMQFTVFFGATIVWAVVLWKVVKRSRHGTGTAFSNIVGDTAIVDGEGLHKGRPGKVTWSGTIMRAELDKGAAVESLEAGAQVVVTQVSGATLFVKPKP